MAHSLLIVEDEKHTREGLMMALEDDYDVYVASDADEAFTLMGEEEFEIILTDLRMAGKSGMKVIEHAVQLPYKPVIIMMTAYGNVETAVEAMKRGAYDFLTKPVNLEKLEILLQRAIQSKTLKVENQVLHQRLDEKYSFKGIIGNSKALNKVLKEVELVAPSKATVMVYGDTGTGKEMIAQSIHQNSPRARGPFVAVHCAALASNLLESELFGHEKGAFTGAAERRIGRFEAADHGSLFLDEIGEIDASTQVKLLRFLETKTFERLGSIKPIQVDVRLICATNRDLLEMVSKGEFREDLYYRLNVVKLELPSLKQRKEDIPLLLDHYVKIFAKENGLSPLTFSTTALHVLQEYNWPGNIRELRNFCENMVVMHRGPEVSEYDLAPHFIDNQRGNTTVKTSQPIGLSVEENEKRILRNALHEAKGNRTKAAELMGISRRTLHRKLNQWPELDTKD